jgi:hypothetical protein
MRYREIRDGYQQRPAEQPNDLVYHGLFFSLAKVFLPIPDSV